VKLLLNDQRVDIKKASKQNWTPFWVSCFKGHDNVVKLLLVDERINVYDAVDNETAFFVACEKGHLEVVKILLIDNRIDFNQANICGIDALWISASNGHLSVVEYLLNSGKKFNLKSKWDVDVSSNQANHKTVLEQVKSQISPQKVKFSWESDEILQKISENCPLILKLLEQYIQKEGSEELIEEEDNKKQEEKAEKEQIEVLKLNADNQINIEKEEQEEKQEKEEEKEKQIEKEEKQEENISQSLQNDEQPINQILLTGEFLKLGKGMLKQWQSRVFDLRLQSLAWKKYQNVNLFISFFLF